MIAEPEGGAHTDHEETGRRLKTAVVRELDRLAAIPLELLVEQRYRRYRSLGAYTEVVTAVADARRPAAERPRRSPARSPRGRFAGHPSAAPGGSARRATRP